MDNKFTLLLPRSLPGNYQDIKNSLSWVGIGYTYMSLHLSILTLSFHFPISTCLSFHSRKVYLPVSSQHLLFPLSLFPVSPTSPECGCANIYNPANPRIYHIHPAQHPCLSCPIEWISRYIIRNVDTDDGIPSIYSFQ